MRFKVSNDCNQDFKKFISVHFEGNVDFCEEISAGNIEFMKAAMAKEEFTGKNEQVFKISIFENGKVEDYIFIGAGKAEDFCKKAYRITLFNALKDIKTSAAIWMNDERLEDAQLLSEIVAHINYTWDKYKEKQEDKFLDLTLISEKEHCLCEIEALNEGTDLAKYLVNEQAEIMTPKKLTEIAIEKGAECGFSVEILDENKALELGMHAFLAVGRASVNNPYVIVMRYMGNPDDSYIHGLVGKGLTYDTGGLCLKPADSMLNMRDDMAGAGTVMGAMCAIAKNKLKKNVVAVIAACENSMGPNAYRPGDIVPTMAGKNIEVINTDAEGRLTLADAMTYIARVEKVNEIVDVATLTGAVLVALGFAATGTFTNNTDMLAKLQKASSNWEETFWHLPILPEFRKAVKSDIACVKNSAGRWAGSSTAAAFLEVFNENLPWMHLDIAGTAFHESNGSFHKKGATGIGVKSLYSYIKGE